MAGLLNSSQQDPAGAPASAPQMAEPAAPAPTDNPAQAGAESLDDPILKRIETGIEQTVPPEHKKMYDSIVVAGMNVMFSKETSNLMEQQLDESDDVVENVSSGVAKLIMIVFSESKQKADDFAPAAVFAAISLLCQALEYWEKSRNGVVTEEIAATATKQVQLKVLQGFGITEEQVNKVAQAGLQNAGEP